MSTAARKSGRQAKPTEKFKEYFCDSEVPPKKDSKSSITRHTQISKEKPLKADTTSHIIIKKRGSNKDSVPAVCIPQINGTSEPLQSSDKTAGLEYINGGQVQVLDMRDNNWYQCKIVDVNRGAQSVLVHYNRWSSRFDEWITMNSFRIQPSHISLTELVMKRQPTNSGEKEVDGPMKLLEDEDSSTKIQLKSVLVEDGNKDVEVPKGWTRRVVMRTSGISAGTFDVYYTSPLGKRLRSKVQVENYCKETGLQIDLGTLKFSHRATDSEKSTLFRKAGNDLAVDVTTETKDNQKVFHSKMPSPAQKSGHQAKPTEIIKKKSEVPPKNDSKSPITRHTQTSKEKLLKQDTTSHTIFKMRGRTRNSAVDTDSLKNKNNESESEDIDNRDTKGSKFKKESEVPSKKDSKSPITGQIQTLKEKPLKPDTTSCTVTKKRGRPHNSTVDTESLKNKNNESECKEEDDNYTKGKKFKKESDEPPKKDSKSPITGHIQKSKETPIKPDTTSCTITKKRGRPRNSTVDTDSLKNKNNESEIEDEDDNDTKSNKFMKVFHSKMSTPVARKSGRQAKTTEKFKEYLYGSDGKPNPPHCKYCDSGHSAGDQLCPKYQKEKEIVTISSENNLPFKHTRNKVEANAVSYAAMTKLGRANKQTPPHPNSVIPDIADNQGGGANIVNNMSDEATGSPESILNPNDLKKITPSTNTEEGPNWDKALAKMTEVFTWVNSAPKEMKEKVNELTSRFFSCIEILQFKHRTSQPTLKLKKVLSK